MLIAWNWTKWNIYTIEISKFYKSVRCAGVPPEMPVTSLVVTPLPGLLFPRSLQNWLLLPQVTVMSPAQRALSWPPWASVTVTISFHSHHHYQKTCFLDYSCKPPESKNTSDLVTALSLWVEQGLALSRCAEIFIELTNEWVWSGRLSVSSWALCGFQWKHWCSVLACSWQAGLGMREGRGGRRGKSLLVWKLLHWTGMGQTYQIHVSGSDVANKNKGYPIKFEIQISK